LRSDSFFSERGGGKGENGKGGRIAMVAKGVGDDGVIGDNGDDGVFRNRREKELSFWAAPEGIGGSGCGD